MNDINEIWIPLAGRFYRVAFHLLESREDAEDAVQELYLKLLSSRKDLSSVQNPAAYGIALLKNICIDRIRRRKVRMTVQIEECMMTDVSGPEKSMVDKDRLARLMEEIDKLPERQALVLRMRTIEGLEYEEIARRTGLSQINIRVLTSMARKTLKRRMDK